MEEKEDVVGMVEWMARTVEAVPPVQLEREQSAAVGCCNHKKV